MFTRAWACRVSLISCAPIGSVKYYRDDDDMALRSAFVDVDVEFEAPGNGRLAENQSYFICGVRCNAFVFQIAREIMEAYVLVYYQASSVLTYILTRD